MTTLGLNMPLVWALIGIGLLVAEMATGTFVLLFFGVSALIVAALGLAGLSNLALELLLFSLIGAGGLILFRRRLKETLSPRNGAGFSIDAQTSFRLSDSVAAKSEASVSYQGSKWTAVNETDDDLSEGTQVVVTRVDGIKLYIRKL